MGQMPNIWFRWLAFACLSTCGWASELKAEVDSLPRLVLPMPATKERGAIPFQKPFRLPAAPIGPDAYARNMGFFCRQEWRWEKTVRIPLRLRLGSLEYVDRMEGKRR